MRQLTREEVVFTVHPAPDDTPVRGNAMASGDDAADKRYEDYILRRLRRGDVWAWASVEVRVSGRGLSERTFLGCCCYRNATDFMQPGGYFPDMCDEVFDALAKRVAELQLENEGGN